jgi:integrase
VAVPAVCPPDTPEKRVAATAKMGGFERWAMTNVIKLTKTSVEELPTTGRRYWVYDSELAGFAVRVQESGSKTLVVQYRPGGGRNAIKRTMTLGKFGKVTVEVARREAKSVLGKAVGGKDPAGELMARRRAMLMSELIDLYEAEGCFIQRGKRQGQPMKPTTKKNTLARLRNHVVPLLGKKRADELNAGDMEKFVADVTAGKTARDDKEGPRKRIIVTGGAGGATKVFCDLSAVFSFALRREIIRRNPCATAAVRRTGNRKERFLDLEELTRLGQALKELVDEGANQKAIDIAILWALTGCRDQEIAALKWPETELEEGSLLLDDSKTGKSWRPLGYAALVLLREIRARRDRADPKDDKAMREKKSIYVFPAERGDGHYQGTKRYFAKAVKKAKLPGVSPHTLRHTMGSTATSSGEALALTGAILGHANPRSTSIYAHVQADPSKRAANRVSKKIAAALLGEDAAKTGKSGRKKAAPPADELLEQLRERLAGGGPEAERIRRALAA